MPHCKGIKSVAATAISTATNHLDRYQYDVLAVVTNLLRQIQRALGGGVLTAEGVWNALMVASSRTAPGMPPLIGDNDRAASSNRLASHSTARNAL